MNSNLIFLIMAFFLGINLLTAQQSTKKYFFAEIGQKGLPRSSSVTLDDDKITICDSPEIDYMGSFKIHKGSFTMDKNTILAHIDTVLTFSANFPDCIFAQINCEKENLDIKKFNSNEIIINRKFNTFGKYVDGKFIVTNKSVRVIYSAIESPWNSDEHEKIKNWRKNLPPSSLKICD